MAKPRLLSTTLNLLYSSSKQEVRNLFQHIKDSLKSLSQSKLNQVVILLATGILLSAAAGSAFSTGTFAGATAELDAGSTASLFDALYDLNILPTMSDAIRDFLDTPPEWIDDFLKGAIGVLIAFSFYNTSMNNRPKVFNTATELTLEETDDEIRDHIGKILDLIYDKMKVSDPKYNVSDDLLTNMLAEIANNTNLQFDLRYLLKKLKTKITQLGEKEYSEDIPLDDINNYGEYDSLMARFNELDEQLGTAFTRLTDNEWKDKAKLLAFDWLPALCTIPLLTLITTFSTFSAIDKALSGLLNPLFRYFCAVLGAGAVCVSGGSMQVVYFRDSLTKRAMSMQKKYSKKNKFISSLLGIATFLVGVSGEMITLWKLLRTYFSLETSLIILSPISILLSFFGIKTGLYTFRTAREWLFSLEEEKTKKERATPDLLLPPINGKEKADSFLLLIPMNQQCLIEKIPQEEFKKVRFILQQIQSQDNTGLCNPFVRIYWMVDGKLCAHECELPKIWNKHFNHSEYVIIQDPAGINEIAKKCKKIQDSAIINCIQFTSKAVRKTTTGVKAVIATASLYGLTCAFLFKLIPSPALIPLTLMMIITVAVTVISLLLNIPTSFARNYDPSPSKEDTTKIFNKDTIIAFINEVKLNNEAFVSVETPKTELSSISCQELLDKPAFVVLSQRSPSSDRSSYAQQIKGRSLWETPDFSNPNKSNNNWIPDAEFKNIELV